jgi:hypothetical protein
LKLRLSAAACSPLLLQLLPALLPRIMSLLLLLQPLPSCSLCCCGFLASALQPSAAAADAASAARSLPLLLLLQLLPS